MARDRDAGSSGAGTFDRDFGYLLPFMDKVEAAASSLPDPAARVELQRLMAGEKQRWARVRELLSGAQGRTAPGAAQGRPVQPGAQLTVGSLKRSR